MQPIHDLVGSGDLFSLLILVILLCSIGGRMIERQADLKLWGMRVAAAAMLGYCLMSGSELETSEPGPWLAIIFRGLLAGGLALGVSWICLSVYGFMKQASDRASAAARVKANDRRREREEREAELERERNQREWERGAPERERQRLMEEEQQRQTALTSVTAQQQRDDIRYSCELFFNQHATTIADRFTRRDLKLFFKQYMNDEQPAEVVQRRANQLMETIRQHVDVANPPEKMTTLEDIANWYSGQKSEIEKLDTGEMIKDEYLLRLKERYAELTEELLESLKP